MLSILYPSCIMCWWPAQGSFSHACPEHGTLRRHSDWHLNLLQMRTQSKSSPSAARSDLRYSAEPVYAVCTASSVYLQCGAQRERRTDRGKHALAGHCAYRQDDMH